MKNTLKSLCLSALLAFTVYGCTTVGPDYEAPTAEVESNWLEYQDPLIDSTQAVAPEWWKSAFNDPILDRLVEISLAQNLSLRSTGLRVLQSQQQLAIAVGNQFPQQQQINGSASRQKSSAAIFNDYSLGFNVGWEIDFWGRFRLEVESASAALDASVANYDSVMVSLISQIAQNYLFIRTTQERLAVAVHNLDLQKESVRVTSAKYKSGEVSALDVNQAQTVLYNTRGSVAALELSLQQLKNSLATLLGEPPQDMSALLGPVKPIPSVAPAIALGMPQDLIRNRPDIRAAERQLASQSAQIGVAVSELYPSFSIGGAIGTNAMSTGDLFESASSTWGLLGGFQWNIFNYGRLKSNIRLQDAVFQQLLEDYRETVLQAQSEVENNIVAFLKSQQQLQAHRLAAEAAQRAATISTAQYRDGLVDFNTVINTLITLSSQQDQLASTQGTVTTNLVAVYKSLGGGWEIRKTEEPRDLIPTETRDEMLGRTKYWKKAFKEEAPAADGEDGT